MKEFASNFIKSQFYYKKKKSTYNIASWSYWLSVRMSKILWEKGGDFVVNIE